MLETVSTLTRSESNDGSSLVDLGDVRDFSKDCRRANSWADLPPNAVSEGCDSVSNMASEWRYAVVGGISNALELVQEAKRQKTGEVAATYFQKCNADRQPSA